MSKVVQAEGHVRLAFGAADQHDGDVQTEPMAADPVSRAQPTDQPELTVAAAARRLGVAPATLRTWDRRYGIGPSEHTPGQHRRYSPADVARLELMQRALIRGASPADAARLATTARLAEARTDGAALLAEWPAEDGGTTTGVEPQVRVGGVALRLPGAGRRAHGLARAALMLDPLPVRALMAESLATAGVEATWDEVIRPVFNALAERWEHTGAGVEIEHQLSECVSAVFRRYADDAAGTADARPVLLVGMPGEQHVLPLGVLCAALAESGIPSRTLGANLPVRALVDAIRQDGSVGRRAVVAARRLGRLAGVESLPRTRPRFHALAAGPGWADRSLPPRVGWLDTLGTARRTIANLVPV